MRFENGRLGAMILVLGIVLAILGSYVLSLDVQEHEVTKYEYVTDLTGLFETTQAPTYIDYNPSENYTGYYTSASRPYFDGVDYTEAVRPNLYRLNLEPLEETTTDYQLNDEVESDNEDTLTPNFILSYAYSSEHGPKAFYPKWVTLASLMSQMGYNNVDEIVIVCSTNSIDWSSQAGDWITFGTGDMYQGNVYYVTNPNINGTELTGTATVNKWYKPILGCRYNLQTQICQLFYDTSMTDSAGIASPTEIRIFYDGFSSGHNLGDDVTISTLDLPDPEYMDPSQGVEVS